MDGWLISPVAPCKGVETVSFAMGLRPLKGIMSLTGGNRFTLGGGPFTIGRLFFRGQGSLVRLFEEGFGIREI